MLSKSLDFRERESLYHTLESTVYDVLIIGAGITGCGVARDAAARGLRVALVDARDMASGTSSRSSKLIHGGGQYLASGQFSVIREAAVERTTLRDIAPHLTQRTSMVLPTPSVGSLLKYKAGMHLYERLGQVKKSDHHVVWSRVELQEREPTVLADRLRGAVVYHEYITDDSRLTIANARSARGAGADVLTYAPVTEILSENGKACGAVLGDAFGSLGARVRARVVINAAGPWLDAVRKLEENRAPDILQLTKGIHVVLKRERLPIQHTVIMQTQDKRSVFLVPRGEFVYFGTTDTFYPEAENSPVITREDVRYLMDSGERMFKGGPFTDEDIVSVWAGLRPLLGQGEKKPGNISRKNEILHGPAGVLSIAGGKLTSYRSMAERIVDECEEMLGVAHRESTTATERLPGGECDADLSLIVSALEGLGMGRSQAERAAALYGSEANTVFAQSPSLEAEVVYSVLHEGACTLDDFWTRRSSRAHFDHGGGLESLAPAAATMGELLNWSPDKVEEQISECRSIRENEMHFLQT